MNNQSDWTHAFKKLPPKNSQPVAQPWGVRPPHVAAGSLNWYQILTGPDVGVGVAYHMPRAPAVSPSAVRSSIRQRIDVNNHQETITVTIDATSVSRGAACEALVNTRRPATSSPVAFQRQRPVAIKPYVSRPSLIVH
ncbi:hypothetical protein DPEC_G00278210 [Dallia pectoralis]|uniref:Uncharacterized protein n=1 Tax=Dallia pectoralis TaxID=75939 RepID=A0ACC2FM03_DALPE|nr:hypothetical protein DPEC_G00278210 [Dallia pectoralis]